MDPRPYVTINGQYLDALPQFTEWQRVVIACVPPNAAQQVQLRIGTEELGSPSLQLGDATWRWHWNPENKSGAFRAELTIDGDTWCWTLDVVPSKLSIEHYHRLLQAVEEVALDLLLALGGGEIGAAQGAAAPQSLLAQWSQLQAQVAQAVEVAGRIAERPHHTQQRHVASLPLHELHELDGTALASLASEPLDHVPAGRLPGFPATHQFPDALAGQLLPQRVRTIRKTATTDCVEHRVLRTVIDRLALRVAQSSVVVATELRRATSEGVAKLQHLHDQQRAAARQLRLVQALPLIVEVKPLTHFNAPTQLMRHDWRYKRLYALWRSLQHALELRCDNPILMLPLAELPLLYEQWCVLMVAAALVDEGVVLHQQLFEQPQAGHLPWRLRLTEHVPLLRVQLDDEREVVLRYHRRYEAQRGHQGALGSLDPYTRIPDIALEVQHMGRMPQTLLLDAKYRMAPDGTLPQSALDTAYTYHGAIGYNGVRATLGAWLLFPGTEAITAGSVGALQLLPDAVTPLHDLIHEVVSRK